MRPFQLKLPNSSFSVKVSRVTVDSILIHGKLISKSLKSETVSCAGETEHISALLVG